MISGIDKNRLFALLNPPKQWDFASFTHITDFKMLVFQAGALQTLKSVTKSKKLYGTSSEKIPNFLSPLPTPESEFASSEH